VAAGVAAKGKRVTILVHRTELIDQTVAALKRLNLTCGVIANNYESDLSEQIQVASVWTLRNRIYKATDPDLVVIDEAHHCTRNNTWGTILQHYANAKRLGVTATPIRLSGEGLADIFDTMVVGPSTSELIEKGYLTPVKVYAPTQPDLTGIKRVGGDYSTTELEERITRSTLTGDAITHYKRLCEGRKAIVFCVSVRHAQRVAESFTAAGYRAASIDGSMDRHERKNILEKFKTGEILVLTSCDLVSEGFDVPSIEVGISLRPTTSTALWIQQVGRCLRTHDGKHNSIILDHAGNTYKHGLPDRR
jgi:superfamily II DNA or RNA helicase